MDLRAELKKIIADAAPKDIWRSIYDESDALLAEGHGDPCEGRPEDLCLVDFKGLSVLDVGCNFGFHSFLARRLGAREVVGVDVDAKAVRACDIQRALNRVEGVRFVLGDFTSADLGGPFDVGLLINFFGKEMILGGIRRFLEALDRQSRSRMIVSAKWYYKISRHFGGDRETLLRHYPERYLDGDRFLIQDYVRDFFRSGWDVRLISPEYADEGVRRTFLFTRKRPGP